MGRSDTWNWLRLSRSDPPGVAAKAPHAKVYRAALQQFEDLMNAAEATGYAARPLPLFYALSQAGQAIEACAGQRPARNHGLDVKCGSSSPLKAFVEPREEDGRFQGVSACVASPSLSGKTSLGSLMASVIELSHFFVESPWPVGIEVYPREILDGGDARGFAYHRDAVWETYDFLFPKEVRTVAEVGQILARYPDAEGKWRPISTTPELLGVRAYAGRWVVRLLWNDGGKGISGVAPDFRGVYVLRPALVDGEHPPSLLMTWWLITYTISELARYEPERWVNALKVDSSHDAVPLERCMDTAIDVIPDLVLAGILDAARGLSKQVEALS